MTHGLDHPDALESAGARGARQQAAAASLRARTLASVPFSTRFAVRNAIGAKIPKLLELRRREQAWCEAVILSKVFDGALGFMDSGEETIAAEGALRGITIGFVEGPARLLHDFHDCETLAVGDIMVAPVADLAWTPYFLRASGLVVEIGGLLSHGSIVARGYGLPAIVGVPDAMRRIRTGDRIKLDANRGVEVVSVGSSSPTHA